MTTEIAVLNRLGVALATDSAVTISGGDRTKICDTADKLFELSPIHPVGVMINGNMDCIGVPWEIINKDFREQKGYLARDTIRDWLDDFLSFVEQYSGVSKLREEVQFTTRINTITSIIKNRVSSVFFDLLLAGSRIKKDQADTDIEIQKVVRDLADHYSKSPVADSVVGLTPQEIFDVRGAEIDAALNHSFAPHEINAEARLALRSLIAQVLLTSSTSDFTTGIVVAGYGAGDIFPSVDSVEIDGLLIGKLKFSRKAARQIGDADVGKVVSFAQTDVIERLLGGADPRFVVRTSNYIRKVVFETSKSVEAALRNRPPSRRKAAEREALLREIADEVATKYVSKTAEDLKDFFTQEFDQMIALMPKQEVIDLAEALVNITAVERKASSDEGTVGGAIDVAMITKHEGFVWIKRKQYFDGHLNPRYFWRRFGRSGDRGEHGEDALRSKRAAARPTDGGATSQR